MARQSNSSNQASWDANRRKHEKVLGKALPQGAYEDAYTWDGKASKHAENRNERAAQQFGTIYGNTRPGDDWEYAGQQDDRTWRGKDGSGGGTPGVGIWKRKAAAAVAPPASKAAASTAAPAPAPAPAQPAASFDPLSYASRAQPAPPAPPAVGAIGASATGANATGAAEDPGGYAAMARARMPGRTISSEGFDVTPHYYNAWVAGKASANDEREADGDGMRFAGSQRFRQSLHQRIAAAQQLAN